MAEPLLLKGVVIDDGASRCLLAALDWCTLGGEAHAALRRGLAEAAGTSPAKVALHCVHTHSAPSGRPWPRFLEEVTGRAAAAVRASLPRLRPVTHVGFGRAKVEGYASNRRVPGRDGKIRSRWSACTEPALRDEPEGLIDPWLRTVTLFDGEVPVVRLHYYACHPQSHYRDRSAHPDVPGWARSRLEKEEGVPQIYFTGAAGNITAGKYNDGSPAARAGLIDRLAEGMRKAVAASRREPLRGLTWSTGAVGLAWRADPRERPPLEVQLLRMGPVDVLHLPGEPFVEYQIFAQNLRPDRFVAVAGYGDGEPGYLCTDAAFDEGGYEPTASRTGPPSESRLKAAIAAVLEPPEPWRGRGKVPFYADRTRLLVFLDDEGGEHLVRDAEGWAIRRRHILARLQEVTGPLPDRSQLPPLGLEVVETVDLPGVVRKKITFVSEPGDRVSAYLLLPKDVPPKVPGILCLHPTDRRLGKGVVAGLDPRPGRAYALELAARGYVTLAPDYPDSGDRSFDPYRKRYASATLKAVWDHLRAVDLLRSLPEVDPDRLGAIGHSLGGHNAIFAAVFDERLRAVVSSCGFTAFAHYKGGNLAGWSHAGYMPRIAGIYGKDPLRVPFDFHELAGALAPRAFLAVAPRGDDNFDVEGVREVMRSAQRVYDLLGVPERLGVIYPEGGHDFPEEARKAAYAWFDRWLKGLPVPDR